MEHDHRLACRSWSVFQRRAGKGDAELVEQEGLKLTTNIVDADFAKLKVGMSVSVKFEQTEDFYIPVFAP